jgi:hypothetical protein
MILTHANDLLAIAQAGLEPAREKGLSPYG